MQLLTLYNVCYYAFIYIPITMSVIETSAVVYRYGNTMKICYNKLKKNKNKINSSDTNDFEIIDKIN